MDRKLPPPNLDLPYPLFRSIALRRSARKFSSEPLTREQIGQLLWSCQGITDPVEGFRTAPSAGGIFPIETIAVLPEGLFRYVPADHALDPLAERDIRAALARASLDQQFLAAAPITIAIAADERQIAKRYGERGRRYTYMEAGHIAENLHLAAVAMGLGSVAVGAFDDAAVTRLLDLEAGFEPLYLLPVGKTL